MYLYSWNVDWKGKVEFRKCSNSFIYNQYSINMQKCICDWRLVA